MKFSIKDSFSKCDQIRRKLQIWSHLLKKSLMESFFLCSARDSCINQLLSIIHDIYKSLYEGYELRGVLLDISRQQNGISGNLLERLSDFLRYGKKRVALNGQVF